MPAAEQAYTFFHVVLKRWHFNSFTLKTPVLKRYFCSRVQYRHATEALGTRNIWCGVRP